MRSAWSFPLSLFLSLSLRPVSRSVRPFRSMRGINTSLITRLARLFVLPINGRGCIVANAYLQKSFLLNRRTKRYPSFCVFLPSPNHYLYASSRLTFSPFPSFLSFFFYIHTFFLSPSLFLSCFFSWYQMIDADVLREKPAIHLPARR